jgi:hypothetical protein
MHWLRFPIRICIDSRTHIWACIDSGWTCAFCFFLIIISRHCVIKWRHNIKILTDLESTYQVFSIWGTTRYGSIDLKIWPWGTQFSTLALTLKVIGDQSSKLVSWVADHVLLSHQVWNWFNTKYLKNKVFVSIKTWSNLTLAFDLDPYHVVKMSTNLLIVVYANDDVPWMENKKV